MFENHKLDKKIELRLPENPQNRELNDPMV